MIQCFVRGWRTETGVDLLSAAFGGGGGTSLKNGERGKGFERGV